MKTDISLIFKYPEKNKEVQLTIEPLAPLSIVDTLPGSYYKSMVKPTKAKLCGMFENIMNWHFRLQDRKAIIKKMKQVYKKSYNIADFKTEVSNVGYTSLIGHLFEVDLPINPTPICRYEDIWKQQLYRDGYAHPNGTPNLSYELIPLKRNLGKKDNGTIKNEEIGKFHKENKSRFPMYYTSPRKREFIVLEGKYQYKLSMNAHLFEYLSKSLTENNMAYLGSSEGWVNLKLETL